MPLLFCILLAGCSHDNRNETAVRQGVLDHLAGRGLNLGSMDVAVTNVIFRKNEADATVSFTPKGANAPGGPMVMHYTLELQGNHWVVKPQANAGANPHGGMGGAGAMGANPHGDMGGIANPHGGAAPTGEMPPGHPAIPPPDSGSK